MTETYLSGPVRVGQSVLADYDEERNGSLLGVSDEGSAAAVIVKAAQECAKAKAAGRATPDMVGLVLDGERMTKRR